MDNFSKIEFLKDYKKFAKTLADLSAGIIKNYFRANIQIEVKEDHSPVTLADKKSEEAMRELIMKEYPQHGIMGEEFGIHNPDAEYKWILDPIDGTKSFICGTPLFGTLIALLEKGEPVLGAVNLPVLNEFLIGDNSSAELNGKKVTVRNCGSISSAVMLVTDIMDVEKHRDIKKFNSLMKKVKLFRSWGDCYGYYLVAGGFADIMIDPVMSPWDTMALIPVIRGAGGIITDYNGNDPLKGNSIIASSESIHEEIIDILN